MKSVVVVGATDGIGLALCRVYLAAGWRLGAVGRSEEKTASVAGALRVESPGSTVVHAVCDVRDRAAVGAVFDRVLRELGQMDLMLYCAGLSHTAPGTELKPDDDLDTFDVNLLGAVSFCSRAANHFAAVGGGHIVAIGSIAGERGRGGNPAYCASKTGLDSYLEGLRVRLHPLGVRVTNVKPGFVNTKMLRGRKLPGAIEPGDAARRIKRALDRRKEVFFVPWWWGLVGLAVRSMPRFLFKRLAPR